MNEVLPRPFLIPLGSAPKLTRLRSRKLKRRWVGLRVSSNFYTRLDRFQTQPTQPMTAGFGPLQQPSAFGPGPGLPEPTAIRDANLARPRAMPPGCHDDASSPPRGALTRRVHEGAHRYRPRSPPSPSGTSVPGPRGPPGVRGRVRASSCSDLLEPFAYPLTEGLSHRGGAGGGLESAPPPWPRETHQLSDSNACSTWLAGALQNCRSVSVLRRFCVPNRFIHWLWVPR